MPASSVAAPIACAWCGRMIRAGEAASAVSYGICLTCLGDQFSHPIEDVGALDDRTADRLPFGFIRLDSEGRVIAYNTAESTLSGLPPEGILGKSFFRTVAPCTCVDEFEGTIKTMMASAKAERNHIEFLFKFKARTTMVDIAMTTDPATGYATLLIRKMGEQSR
jgi:photoactive yellow protein